MNEDEMEERLLNISEFSRLSGISRKALIFYDNAGVFSPIKIGRNRYRRYSLRQLQVAGVIAALRAIDVPLPEIKEFLSVRTPRRLVELCRRQEARIRSELDTLTRTREIIRSLNLVTESAANAKPGTVRIVRLPPARLFMGPIIKTADPHGINEALAQFFELCAEKGVPQIHPLGSTTSLDGGAGESPFRPLRFYCPAGEAAPEALAVTRRGGNYLIGHGYGDYGMLDETYKKMLRFARKRGLEIEGVAYEEYVLSEMALRDPDSYLARVAIRVV